MSTGSPPSVHEQAAAMVVALQAHLCGRAGGACEDAARELAAYGAAAGYPFTILLAPSAVLVGGQTLRAPRWVHEAADELRASLAQVSIAELVVESGPDPSELRALSAQVEAGGHEARETGALQWRPVQALALVRGIDLEVLDPEQHFETAYGWAVAALRRVTSELGPGAGAELRARQIARTLIALPANDLMALVHSDRVRARLSDPAERAIGRTILAIAMMRALTADSNMLADVAMVSMLLEAAQGPAGAHPSLGAHTLQAMSRTDDASVMRTVMAYEALWLQQRDRLGAPWGGERPPSAQACVVHAAMRCFARPELSMQAAIDRLQAEAAGDLDRAVIRLLCAITGNRLPASAPLRPSPAPDPEPRAHSPAPLEPRPSRPTSDDRETFSDEDMADILAELGGSPLPQSRSSRPSRPAPARADDGRASHAPVARSSDAPKRPSGPPSVVPPGAMTQEERGAAAQREFDEAEAAYAMGELEEALAHADLAVTLEPQRARYVALQAYLEAIQEEDGPADAATLIERVDRLMKKQTDARAHYYRGMLLRCAGKTFAARQAFRRGLELAPEDPDLRNALEER